MADPHFPHQACQFWWKNRPSSRPISHIEKTRQQARVAHAPPRLPPLHLHSRSCQSSIQEVPIIHPNILGPGPWMTGYTNEYRSLRASSPSEASTTKLKQWYVLGDCETIQTYDYVGITRITHPPGITIDSWDVHHSQSWVVY